MEVGHERPQTEEVFPIASSSIDKVVDDLVRVTMTDSLREIETETLSSGKSR